MVLSELFTRGTAPYADIYDNKELTRKIRSGWRMPRPPLVILTPIADALALTIVVLAGIQRSLVTY